MKKANKCDEWNKYYREGIKFIGSPYRTHEYVKLKLTGMSHEKALEKLKNFSK